MARTPSSPTKHASQHMDNSSFDEEFGVYAEEILGYDGTNLQRVSTNSSGRLQVDVVTGGSSGVQYTEGDVDSTATGNVVMYRATGTNQINAVTDGSPLPVTDSQVLAVVAKDATLTNATQKTQLVDSGANVIGSNGTGTSLNSHVTNFPASQVVDDGGLSLTVDGTVTADTELPAAAALADDTANPTVPTVGSAGLIYDPNDANWDRVRAVNATLNTAAADSGIQAVGLTAQLDDTTPTSVSENQWGNVRMSSQRALRVAGGIAHDGANSTSNYPTVNGGEAIAHGTNPTAVAAADVSKLYTNRAGILFVIGGHPNVVTLEAEYTAAQTNTAIVTISTGLKIVVTSVAVTADNANTVDVGFRVGFGTASTPTTTGVVSSHPGLAAGSGLVIGDGSGIIGIGADNEDLRITSEVPTTGAIRVVVKYYTIES